MLHGWQQQQRRPQYVHTIHAAEPHHSHPGSRRASQHQLGCHPRHQCQLIRRRYASTQHQRHHSARCSAYTVIQWPNSAGHSGRVRIGAHGGHATQLRGAVWAQGRALPKRREPAADTGPGQRAELGCVARRAQQRVDTRAWCDGGYRHHMGGHGCACYRPAPTCAQSTTLPTRRSIRQRDTATASHQPIQHAATEPDLHSAKDLVLGCQLNSDESATHTTPSAPQPDLPT